jgi:hypothetical protein
MLRLFLRHAGATVAAAVLLLGGIPRVDAQTRTTLATDGGAVAPTLLSDCDITVQSCGTDGGELYSGSETTSSGGGGDTVPLCGSGKKGPCNETTIRQCTSWKITTVSGDASVKDLSGVELTGSFKLTCETWTTVTMVYYWS